MDEKRLEELEASLAEKTRLLRDILDEAPQFIFARDGEGRFILVNRALAAFYGEEPEDVIGHEISEIHKDPEEARRLRDDDAHVISTGESILVPETVFGSPTGKRAIVELSLSPFSVPGLPGKAVLGFGTDITDTRRAQRALFEEKERLLVTLRSLGEGVIATDTEGRISLMNPMAALITGWDEREALGVHIGDVFKVKSGRDARANPEPVREILDERRIVIGAVDSWLERRNGELREITERGAPIVSEEGKVVGAVLIFADVSERRAMEREIEKIRKVEELGLLAGGIAHDFNNILMAVLGNITLAKMGADPESETQAILAEAERAIHQAKRLTAQLSLIAKGGSDLKLERVSVPRLVQESCPILFRGSDADFSIRPSSAPCEALVDASQIQQVLQNLVINAREAAGRGGKVSLAVDEALVSREDMLPVSPGRYVRIDVTDDGEGISADIAQRIFDPYFTTKSRGSGLGLTVSFSIVKRHGGCISLRSRKGEGATFSVYLPAAKK
jgi:PAS domain S-box-containing protein